MIAWVQRLVLVSVAIDQLESALVQGMLDRRSGLVYSNEVEALLRPIRDATDPTRLIGVLIGEPPLIQHIYLLTRSIIESTDVLTVAHSPAGQSAILSSLRTLVTELSTLVAQVDWHPLPVVAP